MRKNTIWENWKKQKPTVNGWLAIPSSFSAELMTHQGWDSLTIDLQHGVADYQVGIAMLQAISTTPTIPLARVPWLEPGIIMRMLDAGVMGVICPMVNRREDAERFLEACYYPPVGQRSFGPIRAMIYGGDDYAKKANDEIIPFAMIETKQALDNLDEILRVEGLKAIYVGPADLSNSLGCTPKLDQDEKPVVEAIDLIVRKSLEHGVLPGLHNGTPEYAMRMIEKGFRFVTISNDVRILAGAAEKTVSRMRELIGVPAPIKKEPAVQAVY